MQHRLDRRSLMYFLSFQRAEETISGTGIWAEQGNGIYVSDSENMVRFYLDFTLCVTCTLVQV